jgi:hypothetical protein
MTQLQEQIRALKDLLDRITPLREEAAQLREGLDQVKRDYGPVLGELNRESERLQDLKKALDAQLAGVPEPPPRPEQPLDDDVAVQPPPKVPDFGSEEENAMPEPLPVVKDERAERKRDIADHIESMLPIKVWSSVLQDVNAIVADPIRDVGDMLELVPWGDFWTVRPPWETTLEEQLVRLTWWQEVLERRLTYWQDELRNLKKDDHYRLWQRMVQLEREEWLSLLDDLRLQQLAENDELQRQVTVLQRRLDKQPRAREAHNA